MAKETNNDISKYLKHLINYCNRTFTDFYGNYTLSDCDFECKNSNDQLSMTYGGGVDSERTDIWINVKLTDDQKNFHFYTERKTYNDDDYHPGNGYTETVPVSAIKNALKNNEIDHGDFLDDSGKDVLKSYFKQMLSKLQQDKHQQKTR